MTETKTYTGFIALHSWGEADDILFLTELSDPLAEQLEIDISGKQVTARYWVTDEQCTKEEASKAFIHQLYGKAEAELNSRYSEITGYLWTDEEINIGGHDLLNELNSYIGKYLILEIEIHSNE